MSWLSRNLAKLGSDGSREGTYFNCSGIRSYLDAGGKQLVVEMCTSSHYLHMRGVWLDTSNLTQNGTFTIEYEVDGSSYRHVNAMDAAVTGGTTKTIYIDLNIFTMHDFRVYYTEGADEGAARDIPYSIIYTAVKII